MLLLYQIERETKGLKGISPTHKEIYYLAMEVKYGNNRQ